MEILEKVAYMKGLADGLELDTASKEGKLLKVMMDILEDVALELRDIRDEQDDMVDALDAVSDDLADVESCLYEDDEGEEEDDDSEVYQTTCPNCEEDVFFDESVLAEGGVACPNCGEKLEFELEPGCGGCCGACGDSEDDEDEDDE